MPNYIKQIKVGESNYDLNVLAIQDELGSPKTWTDITSLVQAGFTIEVPWTADDYASASAPSAEKKATVPAVTIYYNNGQSHTTGTLAASGASTKTHIYLIYHAGHDGDADTFDEYVSAGSGASSTWEKIGNTDVDLSAYAKKVDAAAKGTYVSGGPSSNVTSSAGAATITTSSSGSQTAVGTATVTYDKAATATGSSGGTGTAANTGEAGGATIQGSNFSFSGTTATITLTGDYTPEGSITGSQSVSAHSHTVNVATSTVGYISAVDAATGSAGAHTHDVDSHTHSDNQTVILSTGLATATISAFNSGGSAELTTKNYGFASSVSNAMYSPTVSTLGVLSWSLANANTQDALTFTPASGTTKTVVTGVKSTGGTVSVAGAWTAATLTAAAKSAGAHTHSIGSTDATLTYVTGATLSTAGAVTISGSNFGFSGSAATISVSGNYQPAGSIGGSYTLSAHSHSYTAPAAHTHSISLTTTTITAGVEVAVSDHTHTVTIASHTHDLGNHTHSTTIPAIDPGA